MAIPKGTKLEIGQTIYVEEHNFNYINDNRSISTATIVLMNGSSAYYVKDWVREKYITEENVDWNKHKNGYCSRIDLKTMKDVSSNAFYGKTLWLTEEAFNNNVQYYEDKADFYKQAKQKLDKMNLKELKQFVEG